MSGTCGCKRTCLQRKHFTCSYNFFINGAAARACTLLLRGGAEQFIEETERSLHDALMIVHRGRQTDSFVAGGGKLKDEG